MEYRSVPGTDLRLSAISFGTGDNAGLMVLGSADEQVRGVARALELGVNYFDTSPDYGKGRAEENLGRVLRELRAEAIVSTKVEIMPPDLGDIGGKIARSLDESLRRLGRDAVDVLMIHNPPRLRRDPQAPYWTPLTPDDMLGPALAALERARDAGKARWFGFACEHAEPDAVVRVLASRRFALVNAWYNLVNPSAGRRMPAGVAGDDYDDYGEIARHALEHGAGVAAIRPLDGGALAPAVVAAGAAGRHRLAGGMYTRDPATFAPEVRRGRAFAFLDRPGRSLPQAAYRFALMNPAITTVVGGFSDVAQLEEAVAAVDAPALAPDELAAIEDVYRTNFGL